MLSCLRAPGGVNFINWDALFSSLVDLQVFQRGWTAEENIHNFKTKVF